jgi:hypothetical protein
MLGRFVGFSAVGAAVTVPLGAWLVVRPWARAWGVDATEAATVYAGDEILADATTPVRKFPLATPVGRFSHLCVLSPAVVNHPPSVISRSMFRAFPAFDCEMRDVDTVTIAEGRTSGHGQLLSNWWNRKPHPVVDLAYLKTPSDEPKFLVYPPREMESRLGGTLEKLKVAEVRARNWRGDLRSFHKDQTPPDPAELRRFFGFDD